MRVFVLDNYDSFTFNLVQLLGSLGARAEVHRNDTLEVDEVLGRRPTHLIVSPGPCSPREGGISCALVRAAMERGIPTLGVCLGHQCIAAAFGGRIVRADRPMHGKTSRIRHDGGGVFRNLPDPFRAGRYHSLMVDPRSLPAELEPTAWSDDGVLMGLRHRAAPVEGVQFHPESFLTERGGDLMRNFLAFRPPSRPRGRSRR